MSPLHVPRTSATTAHRYEINHCDSFHVVTQNEGATKITPQHVLIIAYPARYQRALVHDALHCCASAHALRRRRTSTLKALMLACGARCCSRKIVVVRNERSKTTTPIDRPNDLLFRNVPYAASLWNSPVSLHLDGGTNRHDIQHRIVVASITLLRCMNELQRQQKSIGDMISNRSICKLLISERRVSPEELRCKSNEIVRMCTGMLTSS
jgi:hypothetical protein